MRKVGVIFVIQLIFLSGLFSQNVGVNETGASPDASAILDLSATNKGLLFPRLTSLQRDNISSPAAGLVIYNVDCNELNLYNGTSWVDMVGNAPGICITATGGTISTDGDFKVHVFNASGTFEITSGSGDVEYLVIGGGGGGGAGGGGGGGAGGYLTGTKSSMTVGAYTVTVGAGGTGGADNTNNDGTNGGNSVFDNITADGGGFGGGNGTGRVGGNGGSGGGGGMGTGGNAGGTATQGNAGGSSGGPNECGGGGGAGAAGSNSGANTGGNGGNGFASSITGTSVTRAGGGGGTGSSSSGTGGTGGGGNGAWSGLGANGTANTGSGGGGGGEGGQNYGGGTGGSGVVIVRYQFQ